MKIKSSLLAVVLFFIAFGQRAQGQDSPWKAPFYWSVYEYHIVREQQGITDNYIPEATLMANVDWVDKHLKALGCDMICMDGWGDVSKLSANGYRTTHSRTWTHDFAWWSQYLQSRGLKMGIYGNPLWVHVSNNNKTTKIAGTDILVSSLLDPSENARFQWVQVDRPGAEQYVKGYVKYYADMGIKYFRVDFLSWYETGQDRYIGTVGPKRPREQYLTALRWMREAADQYGVFLSLVMPNLFNEAEAESLYGHMFRINEDTGEGQWRRWSDNLRGQKRTGWSVYANPADGLTYWSTLSGRNKVILDPDFIRINTFANNEEKKSVISLCLLSGGALTVADQYNTIGNDLWLYQNKELLALNADGFVGKPLTNDPTSQLSQVWTGQLSGGEWIIGLFNRESSARTRSINFSTLGIEGNAQIRDLWEHSNMAPASSFSASIPAHGCRILKVAPAGATFNSIDAMHVKAITVASQPAAEGYSKGMATVVVTDKDDKAVEGATVTLTFSGAFNQTVSGVTGADGSVALTTTLSAADPVKVIVAVASVSHDAMVYAADKNIVSGAGSRMYLGGTFNGWKLQPMQYKEGWWRSDSMLIAAGDQALKFANTSNWTGDDWGNSTGWSGTAKLSTGGLPNLSFNIDYTALYDIAFNEYTLEYKIENNAHLQLNKAMYVAGTFNNWTKVPMTVSAQGWKAEKVQVKAGTFELKFANTSNWSSNDWGNATGLSGKVQLTTGGKPNLVFTIPKDGTYTFLFNDITLAYSITADIPSGSGDMASGQVSIYPNPAKDQVTVAMAMEGKTTVEILNMQGETIFRETMNQPIKSINLGKIKADGVIFLRVINSKGSKVFKVVVRR
ncbi:MAG TPA: T9SS type A sorting domain-containing protein [Prolixibacteraceae bacterium]|nr:T9SS type A sorting domain-containing protein [Prolixibacteraceae bacterium]